MEFAFSDPLATLAMAAASSAGAVTSIKQEPIKPTQETKVLSTVSTPKKEGNMWYDVGIIKGTSCLVSYYHLPAEGGQGDVADKKVGFSTVQLVLRDRPSESLKVVS